VTWDVKQQYTLSLWHDAYHLAGEYTFNCSQRALRELTDSLKPGTIAVVCDFRKQTIYTSEEGFMAVQTATA